MDTKNKVLAYIYRDNNGEKELLVFDHDDLPDDPTINPQVPAGTINENESPESAIFREVFEESGLNFDKPANYLGTCLFHHQDTGDVHKRHFFEFFSTGLKERWTHAVSSMDEDDGMVFQYYWLPVNEAKEKLVAEMGNHLPEC